MATPETVYLVQYTTYVSMDFGAEPIYTHAGPFASEDACRKWIEQNEDEYATDVYGYPDPSIQEHPVRDVGDL